MVFLYEERIFPGAVIPLQDNEGHHFYATVSEVTNDTVTVDLNHPHAGKDLTFEGEVVESRTATNEEIQEMVKNDEWRRMRLWLW